VDYTSKGGKPEDTVNRKCVCNGLFSTTGMAQRRKDGQIEPPLLTAGDDITNLSKVIPPGQTSYRAIDVINYLLGSA